MRGEPTGNGGQRSAHVLILRQNEPYPYGWVGQEARALANAGYQVTTLTPTGFGYDSPDETSDGVRALRFRVRASSTGLIGYVWEYASSLWAMATRLLPLVRHGAVDVVIVATPPDLLVALALPLRCRGAGVIFDQRDPGPELFEAKFGRRGMVHRLLVKSEQFACRHADVLMPHNEACAQLLQQRSGADADRMFVVGVGPDPDRIFPVPPDPRLRQGRPYLVLWMGTISS
ncbi:MAG TPA: glycosyltransferase, partial [Acidimicrobiales bacterium]|nr:glycosyltransferase [Acidimicrobiales bacterium]